MLDKYVCGQVCTWAGRYWSEGDTCVVENGAFAQEEQMIPENCFCKIEELGERFPGTAISAQPTAEIRVDSTGMPWAYPEDSTDDGTGHPAQGIRGRAHMATTGQTL